MPEILPIPKCSEHRQCLACAFPFWDKLTAEQQEMLCRTTRLVRYRKGERVHSPVENLSLIHICAERKSHLTKRKNTNPRRRRAKKVTDFTIIQEV